MNTEPIINKEDVYKDTKKWRKIVVQYQKPSVAKATWQIVNTLVPLLACWVAVYFVRDISMWLVIPFLALIAGFTVRVFIIFHDCGHQ